MDHQPHAAGFAEQPRDDWDSLRIETPSVIKVGSTYHLYYSGCDQDCGDDAVYEVGHATSPDGVVWTKDPANPVIVHQDADPQAWGYRSGGEPAALFNPADGKIYVYYVSMRFDDVDPTIGHVGILLATSDDGSSFVHHVDAGGARALIYSREAPTSSPPSGAWFGSSTPAALIASDGQVHLFCDYLIAPAGPISAVQIAIDHLASNDGRAFAVVEKDLFPAGRGDWVNDGVRAPTVIQVDGHLEMWFAGETKTPIFGAGIGSATNR